MSEIDWSKAPEGATHFYKCGNMFLKVEGDGMVSYLITDGVWEHNRCHVDSYGGYLIPRPPDWSGDGLPPVGAVCEFMWSSEAKPIEYKRIVVVGQDEGLCVFRWAEGPRKGEYQAVKPGMHYDDPLFRPLRTPEQIAAEERENAVKEMETVAAKAWRETPTGMDMITEICSALYDAGFQVPKQ